jgi:transposase
LTVVVDHDTGRLVWAAAGRDRKTVEAFFDALGQMRCKQIELVSCDMAGWIAAPVADRLPDAIGCVDPFHVVMLATDALDEVRREVCNQARKSADITAARDLKGARFALWKNPEKLTDRQQAKLSSIQKTTRGCTARTCSKSSCARSTGCPPGRQSSRSTSGRGPGDVVSHRSSSSPARSPPNEPASSPRSSTASATPASKRSTPRSG